MSTVFVKPTAGGLVRYPRTMTPMPAEGAEVSLDGEDGKYWRRRLNDGSLVVATPTKATAEVATSISEPTESAGRTERGGRNK